MDFITNTDQFDDFVTRSLTEGVILDNNFNLETLDGFNLDFNYDTISNFDLDHTSHISDLAVPEANHEANSFRLDYVGDSSYEATFLSVDGNFNPDLSTWIFNDAAPTNMDFEFVENLYDQSPPLLKET